jgi:hypothetical protein
MTIEELRVELSLLTVRRERLEGEILALFNRGCLPLEEARKKIDEMEAAGVETETINGVKHLVEKRTHDGQEHRSAILPLWYPQYATLDDIFTVLEMEKAGLKSIKEAREKRRKYEQAWGIGPMDDHGYIAHQEKTIEKIEEYLANKTRLEDLSKALEASGQSSPEEGGSTAWPSYIGRLIDDGDLCPDGKTPGRGLNETAAALVRIIKKPVSWKLLQDTFLKPEGTKYSKAACEQARDYANMPH